MVRTSVVLVVLVVLLTAPAAWPCVGVTTCDYYFGVVPRPGSTFPANAPALAVQETQFSDTSSTGSTSSPTPGVKVFGISRADGGALSLPSATGPGEEWFLLDGGIAPGEVLNVTAQLGTTCTSTGTLTVGPAAPLPSAATTIRLANTRVLPGLGNSCSGPSGTVQHAQLEVTAAADMAPWVPLTRWELEIDGQTYATAGYGAVTTTPRIGVPAEYGPHPIDTFHVQCVSAPDGGGLDAKLAPGVHQVRVLARVVGVQAPVSSNTLSVNLDCQPPALDDAGVAGPADAGAPAPDAGSGSPDAGTTPLLPNGGCGCEAAPMLSVLAGLAFMTRRRRLNCS